MKHRPGEPCAVTSRMHGSVGGGWKRAVRQRAGRLPFTSRKVTDEFIGEECSDSSRAFSSRTRVGVESQNHSQRNTRSCVRFVGINGKNERNILQFIDGALSFTEEV